MRTPRDPIYAGHRYPAEIISYAVWLYFRFPLSLRMANKWHLDEVVVSIAGKRHWLWRAVDQDGFVLDVLVQSRRDKKAAKRLFRKLPSTDATARADHEAVQVAAAGPTLPFRP